MSSSPIKRGPIAWMAKNSVAANLLMLVLVVGGLVVGLGVKQEVFPEFDMNFITISVPYPGASPEEVETGIILAIEESVQGVDGIKRIRSVAGESAGSVIVELLARANPNKAVADIKNAVDRITSFPKEAERPEVTLLTTRREVISIVIYGDTDLRNLHALAEQARYELLGQKNITYVEVDGTPPLEISVEVPQHNLRAYGLSLPGIAAEIGRTSLELPSGGVKTATGEVLLRLAERRDLGTDFEEIHLLTSEDGNTVRLGDVAQIKDGFAETFEEAHFNGKRSVLVKVFRTGDQTPIEVAAAANSFVEQFRAKLPPGIQIGTWGDWSELYRDRVDLLMRNGKIGLILVLIILGMFLEVRLAFWVTMGIPISFLGSLFLLPALDVSINMISLFAFIVTLGMVVDDAIVVGENVFENRQKGMPFMDAAIKGARQVAVPVTFSILTTIAAFMPMFFVPGIAGKLFRVIPAIVVSVLLISLIESLFVLPAHLGHQKKRSPRGIVAWLSGKQKRISNSMVWTAQNLYRPLLHKALTYRYTTIAIAVACFMATMGYIIGGHIGFSFMPRVESDFITAQATLPFGAPMDQSRHVQTLLVEAANQVLEENGEEGISRGIFTLIGKPMMQGGPVNRNRSVPGSHDVAVRVFLVGSDKRKMSSARFTKEWRQKVGEIPGLDTLRFSYSIGPSAGSAIDIQLSHPDTVTLEKAARELATMVQSYEGVKDVDPGVASGKSQIDFNLRPEAKGMGLSSIDVGLQLRSAFFGAEALRQQRNRNEIRVMVRLPYEERRSEYDVESLILRSPTGGEIPLSEAVDIKRGQAYTFIRRDTGRRVLDVTADIVEGETTAGKILRNVKRDGLKKLVQTYPGLQYTFEGERRQQAESMDSLKRGFLLALLVIFGLLAIPFGSYTQPLVVMSAIPFGIIGALIGHLVMGFDLSIISMMGIVALAGVVVNDSLVLVHAANRAREGSATSMDAMLVAGVRRFRPILLTSLTTFFGLAPMIFESSVQARFLIPMAISLGFGVLFATFIILLLVPALYVALDDLKSLFGFTASRQAEPIEIESTPLES